MQKRERLAILPRNCGHKWGEMEVRGDGGDCGMALGDDRAWGQI
ncbi:hypothetical protein [Bartonella sp. ML71XJBT]|nr:hypothetical protein [Bartonella sp. ML71XJBT]